MKHLNVMAALAAGISLLPMVAQADDMMLDGQFYVGGQLGASFATNSDVEDTGGTVEADLGNGFVFGGMAGYDFNSPFRAELEVSTRQNDIDKLAGVSGSFGDIRATTFMVNGFYDFDLPELPVTPYLGIGLGAAHVSIDSDVAGVLQTDDSDTVFAYQGIAGASYALNDAVSLTADYRYLGTATPSFKTTAALPFDADYDTHELRVGMRYTF